MAPGALGPESPRGLPRASRWWTWPRGEEPPSRLRAHFSRLGPAGISGAWAQTDLPVSGAGGHLPHLSQSVNLWAWAAACTSGAWAEHALPASGVCINFRPGHSAHFWREAERDLPRRAPRALPGGSRPPAQVRAASPGSRALCPDAKAPTRRRGRAASGGGGWEAGGARAARPRGAAGQWPAAPTSPPSGLGRSCRGPTGRPSRTPAAAGRPGVGASASRVGPRPAQVGGAGPLGGGRGLSGQRGRRAGMRVAVAELFFQGDGEGGTQTVPVGDV